MLQIKLISPEETYTVRHLILRPRKPIESCHFDNDFNNYTFHLGIFFKEQLVGVCTLIKSSNNLFKEKSQYQLRGMAILENYQGNGYGNKMMTYAENLLKSKNVEILWCNARAFAKNFYKKNNFQSTGKPFNIVSVGLHYIMFKPLK